MEIDKKQRDADILNRIKNSNSDREKQKAFSELYNLYSKPITSFLRQKLRNAEIVEDLKMITFQKVYSNLDNYSSENGAFSTWIYTIAKNSLIDHFRKAEEETLSLNYGNSDDDNSYSPQINGNFKTPEEEMIQKQKIKMVRKAINSIKNENVKRIMIFRYIEQLSFAEIAKIVGVDERCSTIRVAVLRGKKIVKNKIDNMK